MRRLLSAIIVNLFFVAVTGAAAVEDKTAGEVLWTDPGLGGSTNDKSCATCHPKGKNIDGSKKVFKIMGKELKSPEDAVNFCIEKALQGKPIPAKSDHMLKLLQHMKTFKGKKK